MEHADKKWLPTLDNLRNFLFDLNGRNAQFAESQEFLLSIH
jgi:hypothetical protein